MRKIAGMMVVLVLCLVAGLAVAEENGAVAVSTADSALLLGTDGAVRVAAGTYADIVEIADGADGRAQRFSAINAEGKCALMDANGEILTAFEYDSLVVSDDLLIYEQAGKYGALDENLQVVAPCEYTYLIANGAGACVGFRTDPWDTTPDGLYYVTAGEQSATGVKLTYMMDTYTDGLMPALSSDNGRYGYLGTDGQWVIQPQYAYAAGFYNGCAAASPDTGSGIIDKSGNWLVTPKYDIVAQNADGTRWLGIIYGKSVTLIDAGSWNEIKQIESDALYAETVGSYVYVLDEAGTSQLLNAAGDVVFSGDDTDMVDAGLLGQYIVYDGAWGEACESLYDADSKQLAGPYQQLYALGVYDDHAYYVYTTFDVIRTTDSSSGETVLDCDYDTIRFGIIDDTGRKVTENAYWEVASLHGNVVLARDSEKAYLIRLDGTVIGEYDAPLEQVDGDAAE